MLYPYRKSKQIERYIGQFIRVFKGFQVPKDNTETTLKTVPVVYGNMDRVVAALLKKNESFTNERVPIMAVNMTALTPDPTRKLPNTHVDELVIDDKFYSRLVGIPFQMQMELSIYADSQTQLMEILEQILLIFHPRVALQIDSSILNGDYITEITLAGIQPEIQYPMGQNKQVVLMTLSFDVPVTLRYPVGENDKFIQDIRMRIFNKTEEAIPTPEQLISEKWIT
jgi:hypothetical protein